jgi:hypothetical protein
LYYELRATARRLPFADFNESGEVDAADVSRWESGFGTASTAPDMVSTGDANDDHAVDGADFLTWQRQLGETPPEAAFDASFAAAAPVPEPTAAVLLAAAGLALATRRGVLGYQLLAIRCITSFDGLGSRRH